METWVPHARNAKSRPARRDCAATADCYRAGSPSESPFPSREGPRPATPATLDRRVSARAGPGRPPSHPEPEAGGPSWRGRAPLTWLPGAVAPRRQLVHLDADPAALQHRQALARAAYLAHRLGSPEQRAAEARGAGEEPELRAPSRRGGAPGGRLQRRARAAPRTPPWPLLHRRFPGFHGRTSALRRRSFGRPRGKRREAKGHGLRGPTAHRRRGAEPPSGLLCGVEPPRPPAPRPCSDASLPTCSLGAGRGQPVEVETKHIFF